MGNLEYERVHANLQALGLTTVDEMLDSFLESSLSKEKSTIEVFDHLFDEEVKRRKVSAQSTRMKLAGFPAVKTLDAFDFEFQPSIDPAVMRDLATLRFVHNNENVILLGPAGVGKTHIAIALGIEAVRAGFTAYYTSAGEMVSKLMRAQGRDALDRQLRSYARPRVLIVDEIGIVPLEKEGAGAFFRLVDRRYERGSTIFTSNKVYSEWGEILGDPVIASATLDRILHHSTTINIKGESFRLRTRKRAGMAQADGREVTAKSK